MPSCTLHENVTSILRYTEMSLNLIILIFKEMVFTSHSLTFWHPSYKPLPEYKPISPEYMMLVHKQLPTGNLYFHKPTVLVIPQHPETFMKPSAWKHRQSHASKHPVIMVLNGAHLHLRLLKSMGN